MSETPEPGIESILPDFSDVENANRESTFKMINEAQISINKMNEQIQSKTKRKAEKLKNGVIYIAASILTMVTWYVMGDLPLLPFHLFCLVMFVLLLAKSIQSYYKYKRDLTQLSQLLQTLEHFESRLSDRIRNLDT
ncbi:hypothetical protein Bhyg_10942 [Pseudolycoriella hygida]|uniref:Uncharacterized protein n=1 Tax=Pseudolycoriella hygida TaxID=35572 RepID=A0A9Q0MVT5_9DIPT|nr:hypothetical protein Bhyg_10942 [Pseudolycoriella hygida]